MKNQPLLCKIVSMSTEADTCRKYVLPKLLEVGWDNDLHSFTEQRTFTDGCIVVSGDKTAKKVFRPISLGHQAPQYREVFEGKGRSWQTVETI